MIRYNVLYGLLVLMGDMSPSKRTECMCIAYPSPSCDQNLLWVLFHHLKKKKCKSVCESLKITYHCQKQVLLCYTDYIISTTTYCHKTIQNGIDLSTYHQLQMSSSTIRKSM